MDIREQERKGPEHQMLRTQCGPEPLKLEVLAGSMQSTTSNETFYIKYANLGPKTKM